MNLTDGIFDDAGDIGDSLAESQQPPVLSSQIEQYSRDVPVSKRIKYVYWEHCLRNVSEKTYRNHRNLHFPGHIRDQQLDDMSIVQESTDPGLLLHMHVNGVKCALVL